MFLPIRWSFPTSLPCILAFVAGILPVAATASGLSIAGADPAPFDSVVIEPKAFPHGLIELRPAGGIYRPLDGFGPVVIDGLANRLPGEYGTRLLTETRSADGRETRLVYQVTGLSPAPEFAVTINGDPGTGKIVLTLEGLAGEFAGAHPGRLAADTSLVGFNVPTRYAEDYAQHGRFPDLFYHRRLGLWFRGCWDLDYSNAATGDSLYPKNGNTLQGEDAVFFPGLAGAGDADANAADSPDTSNKKSAAGHFLASRLTYLPLRDGSRRPLRERFELSLADNLWGAVAIPANRPSPYREAMKDLMYIDLWAGFYPDRPAFTAWMQETVGRYIGGLCIVQNWQGGGFDSNLPLAIADELPPSPRMVGAPEQLKAWMEQMKSWGLAGLRTNYQLYRSKEKPLPQTVRRALDAHGKPKWHTRPQDVLPVIERQEHYIRSLLGTTATFSDQLTSGGPAWAYVDFTPDNPDAGTIRGARSALRAQARLIKRIVGGPLLSETLNSEFLIGEYVDSGDYGIFEGFRRMITPDYKLRRLHALTVTHGMGLGYRYFFGPPYGGTGRQGQGSRMYRNDTYGAGSDDYRAMTIAWGNAAYLDYAPGPAIFDKALTEAMTVGILQRHYLLRPVREITYEVPASADSPESPASWQTLEALLLAGKNPLPYFARIRVVYENGLTVVINRKDEPLALKLPVFGNVLLPKHAWAVWSPDGAVEGFSGIPDNPDNPGATGDAAANRQALRIDYTRDDHRKLLFINPRTTGFHGLAAPAIFENGAKVYELPEDRRYREAAPGRFEDHFTGTLTWSGRGRASVVAEGAGSARMSFVRIASEGRPERIDKPVGLALAGAVTLRYRTGSTSATVRDGETGQAPFATVALMRFGEKEGKNRELPGRRWLVLPDTAGEWREAALPFRLDAVGTRHVVLRLAVSDTEISGVKPASGFLDVDSIRIEPGQ
ncbi:MAG: hypothetical protein LBK99_20685 [Opitutaceae bacterium]|jgi:hypothetical protein|nr:hypothetical protein [Opitutaceae bacterium]